MSVVEYKVEFELIYTNPGESSGSDIVPFVLSVPLWGTMTLERADGMANSIFGDMNDKPAWGHYWSPTSYLNGVQRSWHLGQVGEVGQ